MVMLAEMDASVVLTWIGIAVCVAHSAMFSGLNLAMFSLSRLRLEVEVSTGNKHARSLLKFREDSNFLLATILWGNVGANVLLTMLSDSVLTGVLAFLFSTVVITCVGEVMPQAYFSRNALMMAALLAPLMRFYQYLLYPITKTTGLLLDAWLGKEGIQYFREQGLSEVIRKHIEADETDLGDAEGIGAMNFFEMDDLPVSQEGELLAPESIIPLEVQVDLPVIPEFQSKSDDPFLCKVQASGKKWVVLTNPEDEPLLVLDADAFLRSIFFDRKANPYQFCHRPIIVKRDSTPLGKVIWKLKVSPEHSEDDVVDHDIILVWDSERRIITGADILGRLLRGITKGTTLSQRETQPLEPETNSTE